jgi:gluconolactonase
VRHLAPLTFTFLLAACTGLALDDPIRVDGGAVAGASAERVPEGRVYKGVPYAAPPVAALRWQPPRPVKAWQGVRDVTEYAPVCAQPKRRQPPAYMKLVAPGEEIRELVSGFVFTEGPAADSEGNLAFTDIRAEKIHRWTKAGELELVRDNSGAANGLAYDAAGRLVACEGVNRRVTSMNPEGEITVLADNWQGKRFNRPNDLWIRPDGGIYFTDPHYGIGRWEMEIEGYHVFYIPPGGGPVIRVADNLVKPNGVVGTPDGRALYVADHGASIVYRYTVQPDGSLIDKSLFVEDRADGMTLDELGNLYLTDDTVAIYNPDGRHVLDIEVPERPANVAFGGPDGTTLFITARTSLYAIEMRVRGTGTRWRSQGESEAPSTHGQEEKR